MYMYTVHEAKQTFRCHSAVECISIHQNTLSWALSMSLQDVDWLYRVLDLSLDVGSLHSCGCIYHHAREEVWLTVDVGVGIHMARHLFCTHKHAIYMYTSSSRPAVVLKDFLTQFTHTLNHTPMYCTCTCTWTIRQGKSRQLWRRHVHTSYWRY